MSEFEDIMNVGELRMGLRVMNEKDMPIGPN